MRRWRRSLALSASRVWRSWRISKTRGTPIPSFVVAIAFGIAGHTLFTPIVNNPPVLAAFVTGSAAIILFSGGLEMPLRDFMRLFVKIALLAVPGVLLTGYAFSWATLGASGALGFAIAPAVAILLGAMPSTAQRGLPATEAHVLRTTRVFESAGRHFNRGQRAFFFALGYLGWFLSPWILFVTTAAVVIVSWRRQFASSAWRAVGSSDAI